MENIRAGTWIVLVLVVHCKSQWKVVYVYKTIICVFLFLTQVIAIVMDMFTDVDIFREIVEASTRGIAVYLLLDESNFGHFLKMTEKQGCQVQRLRVRLTVFLFLLGLSFATHWKVKINLKVIIKCCCFKLTMK